jgi:predicted nucleic acid-binding Zn ribbon protein
MDDAQLRTIWLQRQINDRVPLLTEALSRLMKNELGKRVKLLSRLAEIWDEIIPGTIREHTALDNLQRGVLTVIVDSAAHRYQLQTLLSGGLMREIQRRFADALQKIRIVPGQFYSVDVAGEKRYEF